MNYKLPDRAAGTVPPASDEHDWERATASYEGIPDGAYVIPGWRCRKCGARAMHSPALGLIPVHGTPELCPGKES